MSFKWFPKAQVNYYKQLEAKVIGVINIFKDDLPAKDTESCLSLVEYNEFGIAIENLCEQLYEYDIEITTYKYRKILEVCEIMKIDKEQHLIPLLRLLEKDSVDVPYAKNGELPSVAKVRYTKDPFFMEIEVDGNSFCDSSGGDVLRCFQNIKGVLEEQGIRLLCNGSSRTFMVSGMSSQMGGGVDGIFMDRDGSPRRAYLFEPNMNVDYGTNEEQEQDGAEYIEKLNSDLEKRDKKKYDELKRKGLI